MRKKLAIFNEWQILNKAELIYSLNKLKEHLEKSNDGASPRNTSSALIDLLDKFVLKINESNLPDLNNWWFYDYHINNFDITLSLCHCEDLECDSDGFINMIHTSDSYDIITVPCNMLTVNEFADINNVKPLTVRQWIRRGKLRKIKKLGRDWLISELADPPSRKYEPVSYYWDKELLWKNDLSYLNDYNHVFISQNKKNKSQYDIILGWPNSTNLRTLKITKAERERLELTLLSNESVTAEPLYFGLQYCPAKEDVKTNDFSTLKHKQCNEAILSNYGSILVTKGAHSGRIGFYDDDDESGKAVVYFGDIALSNKYYTISHSHISKTIPTIMLVNRMQHIYSTFNNFTYDYEHQIELLLEYILCYNILNERFLNSMNSMNTTQDIQIFISHATKDMYFSRTIATDLIEEGFSVFLDDWSIDVGDRIHNKINDGLESCNALVMIISKSYLHSTYCSDEWSAFYKKASANKNCLIYPIIIDDSEPPALISTIKYARVDSSSDYTSTLNKLLKALKKHFNKVI